MIKQKTIIKYVLMVNSIIPSIIFSTNSNSPIKFPDNFGVNFDQSMLQTHYYKTNQTRTDIFWKHAKDLYEKYIAHTTSQGSFKKTFIPKIIHHIWLGSPLPKKYKELRNTWIKKHPNWKFILWTDQDIENFDLQNKKLYDATDNYGIKSDIARYEILYRYGGLYVDTDFECLHSFDFLHSTCNFYSGLGFGNMQEVYNGLIGSTPKHPILKTCIEKLSESKIKSHNLSALYKTGPYYFAQCILDTVTTQNLNQVVLLPVTYCYPWPHYCRKQKKRSEIETWFKPESIAVHHWHVSWKR